MKRYSAEIEFKGGPQVELESKLCEAKLEVKEAVKDGSILHLRAYALAFGNVDSWGDIIEPGACDEFLKSADADRMALCYQHDRATVIGKITDKGVDAYGMWIEADILPTTAGKDAAILLKSGAINEFSIGYRATKYEWEKREGYDYEIRVIKALTIFECSPVTIAANPAAIVVSAKSLGHVSEEESGDEKKDENNDKQTNTKSSNAMTPEEIKAMRESIEKQTADLAAELKAKDAELKAQRETIDAQEKSIDNLDKSMKALQAKYDELKGENDVEKVTFFAALKAAMESKKDEIKGMLDSHRGSFKLEFEVKEDPVSPLSTGQITNIAYGVALEPGVHSARLLANAFYEAFGKDVVRATQFNWLEGEFTDNADYVEELAAAADDTAAVVEKSRLFGKLAAHLRVSSEVADFFEEVYNWARNTAQLKIAAKLDNEIFQGLGADSGAGTSTKKVYGLKSQATAFSATGAKYKNATIADVILDAQMQAMAYGYTINKAFVSFADLANIRGLKNANGNYLYNEVTGILNGVAIVPTPRVTAGTMLLADTSIVRIKERPVWELEIVRNAQLDGWDVYVRKAAQTLVKTNDKKGLIWVASISTAISAITEAGTVEGMAADIASIKTAAETIATKAAGLDNLAGIKSGTDNLADIKTNTGAVAGAVDETDHAIKTKSVSQQ